MNSIKMIEEVGSFAEDKDVAARIRNETLLPTIKKNESVVLDFDGVTLVTQSFIHALIAQVLRENGERTLKLIQFKNCTAVAKGIIETVVQYVLESVEDPEPPTLKPRSSK
jgi:hypothetical protein